MTCVLGVFVNLKSLAELTRINHGLLVAIGVLVGEIIVLKGFPDFNLFVISALCGVLIQIGSFTLGDYFDVETDKKNKRFDRPLARGDISPNTAFAIAVVSFLVGLTLGYLISQVCFYVAAIFAFIGIAYACVLKRISFVGNISIALCMAIPFIFGAYVYSNTLPLSVLILASMAFLAGTGREIIKGIQDMPGDRKTGRRTLAIVTGAKKSSAIAAFFILAAIVLSVVPFFYIAEYYLDLSYGIFVGIADILFIIGIIKALKLREFKKIRSLTLYAQFTGVLGFLLGALL